MSSRRRPVDTEPATAPADSRFHAIFARAMVGLACTDLDGRFVEANGKLCEMLGYTVKRVHHPNDSDADQGFEQRLVAGEIDNFAFEKRYIRKDGSVFWANRTVSLARDEAGRPKYLHD